MSRETSDDSASSLKYRDILEANTAAANLVPTTIDSDESSENERVSKKSHIKPEPVEGDKASKNTSEGVSKFVTNKRIGMGSFATVYRGIWYNDHSSASGVTVAVKIVTKAQLQRDKRILDNFESEMAIMKQLKHPHVVELVDVVQSSYDFNLIMEFCSLGDLSKFIRSRDGKSRKNRYIVDTFSRYPSPANDGLNSALIKHLLVQLASSVAFLRSNNLIHRDIKPHNLLLSPPLASLKQAKEHGIVGNWSLPVLKLADFGFARVLPTASMAETLCGSPLYMAPEILNYEKYDAKVDLWSIGAVVYEMAVGKPPFSATNYIELSRKIEAAKDKISYPYEIDPDLKKVIDALLVRDPLKRINFAEFFDITDSFKAQVSLEDSDSDINRIDNAVSDISHELNDILDNTPSGSADFAKEPSQAASETKRSNGSSTENIAEAKSRQSSHSSRSDGRSNHFSHLVSRAHHRVTSSNNEFAVESASPSPESSLYGSKIDQLRKKSQGSEQENEYVFIEKRNVEVNSLADDFQHPQSSRRRSTNPESKGGRRRLSSILYGASPTNAMAQALLRSSARLFNSKTDSKDAGSKASMQTDEKSINDELEQLGTIGKVVTAFADWKFSQVSLKNDMESNEYDERSLSPLTSTAPQIIASTSPAPKVDDMKLAYINSQILLLSEALSLHLKALGILGKSMQRLSSWWEARLSQADVKTVPSGINALVQWIREKFNECVERADVERTKISRLTEEYNLPQPVVNVERLLFDRALELSRNAAEMEMSMGLSSSQVSIPASISASIYTTASGISYSGIPGTRSDQAECLSMCQLNYGTSLWLLKAFAEPEQPGDTLSDDDHTLVQTLMTKIARRLENIRQRSVLSSTTSLNQTFSDNLNSAMSDSSAVFHIDDLNSTFEAKHDIR